MDDGGRPEAVEAYIAAMAPGTRRVFDRLERIVREEGPEAVTDMSYGMLRYRVGDRRLFVGAWKHGLSIYGWPRGSEVDFVARHPSLMTSKGTIRLPQDAAIDVTDVTDADLRGLVRAALVG
jgi:uncharacterized protein YdhG (YjbR/CyaY superfamily)